MSENIRSTQKCVIEIHTKRNDQHWSLMTNVPFLSLCWHITREFDEEAGAFVESRKNER